MLEGCHESCVLLARRPRDGVGSSTCVWADMRGMGAGLADVFVVATAKCEAVVEVYSGGATDTWSDLCRTLTDEGWGD